MYQVLISPNPLLPWSSRFYCQFAFPKRLNNLLSNLPLLFVVCHYLHIHALFCTKLMEVLSQCVKNSCIFQLLPFRWCRSMWYNLSENWSRTSPKTPEKWHTQLHHYMQCFKNRIEYRTSEISELWFNHFKPPKLG